MQTGRHGYSFLPAPSLSVQGENNVLSGDTFALVEAGIAKEHERAGELGEGRQE